MSSARRGEYVLIRSQKQKKHPQVVYADPDEYYSDEPVTTQIVRTKQPTRHVKYVSADESYHHHQSSGASEKARVHVRKTTNGEKVLIDDDDNIIKVFREPTPESNVSEGRQIIYYETPEGHLVTKQPKKKIIEQSHPKTKVVYRDDEPTKVIRKVIIDSMTGDRKTVYEREKPKKQVIIHRDAVTTVESDDEDQQSYVRVVQKRVDHSPRREAKYVIYKDQDEPQYTYPSSSSSSYGKSNRIVYEIPKKTYLYSASKKYYK
ncbi:unnamed protein product [Didymodactylos carnosus]|uniref:Uncharacterized protein n=1 Tax=Didymodactylos carnosus TaxID=1234261 RepID=A0A813NQR5_9BILA|nr:unnamed protein product [Didymodactylos carnosus]CAF3520812.1 unnamed protein product [Didymodactylos carnosus]